MEKMTTVKIIFHIYSIDLITANYITPQLRTCRHGKTDVTVGSQGTQGPERVSVAGLYIHLSRHQYTYYYSCTSIKINQTESKINDFRLSNLLHLYKMF